MVRLGLQVLGEVKCHFHLILSRVRIIHMTYHSWCRSWSPGWDSVYQVSPLKLLLFSFLYCPLWKKSRCATHTWGWRVRLHLPEDGAVAEYYPPHSCPRPSPWNLSICLRQQRGIKDAEGWWEKGGMPLRFICSSSEVCNSQPCTTMPGFSKDSEPGNCIALQEVLFPPWPYSFSLCPWHACHWGAWKQIHALGREGEFGGRFETLPPTPHSCWRRASRLLSAYFQRKSDLEGPWELVLWEWV